MKYNNTEYDGCIVKPDLNEDLLEHFGVKGMRWRHRKSSLNTAVGIISKYVGKKLKKYKHAPEKTTDKYVESHINDDIKDKRAKSKDDDSSVSFKDHLKNGKNKYSSKFREEVEKEKKKGRKTSYATTYD